MVLSRNVCIEDREMEGIDYGRRTNSICEKSGNATAASKNDQEELYFGAACFYLLGAVLNVSWIGDFLSPQQNY